MRDWLREDDAGSFNRTLRKIGEDYYAANLPEDEDALTST
jgi:hypothetical protein